MSLTKSDMERMASDLRSKLGLTDAQPLNPFEIALTGVHIIASDDLEGLDVETATFLNNQGQRNWSAMSVPLDKNQESWAILVNATCDVERQRVSLLEEFWHILQGHKLTKVIKVGEGFGRSFDEENEHDAYYLASATLLPEKSVREFVTSKRNAEFISSVFGTSKELVEYRIKRLGIWNEYKGKEIKLVQMR